MALLHEEEEEEPNGRWKEQWGTEVPHLSEPQKPHLTDEFAVLL